MVRSKTFAMVNARGKLGSYRSVSMALMACRETSHRSARSAWLHRRAARSSRSRFFMGAAPSSVQAGAQVGDPKPNRHPADDDRLRELMELNDACGIEQGGHLQSHEDCRERDGHALQLDLAQILVRTPERPQQGPG